MKKWITAGSLLCLACTALLATPAADAYKKLFGSLSDREVQVKIQKNQPLPLYINETNTFKHANSKAVLIKNAKQSINKYKDYIAYHNAAITAFAEKEPAGLISLTKEDYTNAIAWSTKALELNNTSPTPHMYILRGLTRATQINLIESRNLKNKNWVKENKTALLAIAADFEKVYQLNQTLGTHFAHYVVDIYTALDYTEKAKPYKEIAKQEEQLRNIEIVHRLVPNPAIKPFYRRHLDH